MAKHWSEETALVEAICGNLFDALPLLPKRLVRIEAITRAFSMPFSHIQILIMLSDRPMTIGEISSHLGIAKPNISPLLESLKNRGYLERTRDERDRRVVHVQLLPGGVEVAARIRDSIGSQVMGWPDDLSVSDLKRVNNALALLIKMGRRLAEQEQEEV